LSLPQGFLDELKARVSLPDLVARKVKLVRSGRDLKGCCPFHKEKTPSFHVFPDHYHCFGCGAHGDAIRFLVEAEGQDFMGAVRQLADAAGMAIPEAERDEHRQERAGLFGLLEAAASHYEGLLWSAAGADARAYLARRSVPDALARAFRLGWAPASGIQSALRKAVPSATPQQLAEAGLAVETEDGRLRDRFRGRLMFPILDPRGRVVGFGGRLLGEGEPKYLNSADGPLFHKGSLLFNLHRAAAPARKAGRLILVEGYMDVIALARAGIAECVAPLGTAITEDQLELAWKVAAEPLLAMDGDTAGQRAAMRVATRALPRVRAGRSLRFIPLSSGMDPDDLVSAGGAPAFEALADRAIPLVRWLFDAEAASGPLDTPERRAALRARMDAHARAIPDPDLARDYRETWRAKARQLFGPDQQGSAGRRNAGRPAAATPSRSSGLRPLPPLLPETRAALSQPVTVLPQLLKALADRPLLAEAHVESLAMLEIANRRLAAVRDAIIAGNPEAASALGPVSPLVPSDASESQFHALVGAALESLHRRAHVTGSAVAGVQLPDDASVKDAYARASRSREQAAAHRDRLRRQAIGDGD
jgi:DNA primase